jgi:hypothetical protein
VRTLARVIELLVMLVAFVSGGRPEASKRNLNFQGATWHQFFYCSTMYGDRAGYPIVDFGAWKRGVGPN